MNDKEKSREFAVESIAHLASCAPSIRENFWNSFTPKEIEEIQIGFYGKAEGIVVQIEEGKTDSVGFSRYLYSNPLLTKGPPSKLQGAIKEMQSFFNDKSEQIKRSIVYAGSGIQIPNSDPVAISESNLIKAGIDIKTIHKKVMMQRTEKIEQINRTIGDPNAQL